MCVQFWDVDVKRNKIQAMSLRDSGGPRVMEMCVLFLHVGGKVGEGVSKQREEHVMIEAVVDFVGAPSRCPFPGHCICLPAAMLIAKGTKDYLLSQVEPHCQGVMLYPLPPLHPGGNLLID